MALSGEKPRKAQKPGRRLRLDDRCAFFRETAAAIALLDPHRKAVSAVEMEAAALYNLARVTRLEVLCPCHVTNTMGRRT